MFMTDVLPSSEAMLLILICVFFRKRLFDLDFDGECGSALIRIACSYTFRKDDPKMASASGAQPSLASDVAAQHMQTTNAVLNVRTIVLVLFQLILRIASQEKFCQ
jgi:hypothetical protein